MRDARAILLLLAAALGACGSGEELTRAQFVERGERICDREIRALSSLASGPVRSAAEGSERARRAQQVFEHETQELRRLEPEAGARGDRDRLAGLAERRAGAAREARAAADRSDKGGYLRAINSTNDIGREFDRVAARAGLRKCAASANPRPPSGGTGEGISFPLPKTPGFRFTRPTESPETFLTGSGLDTLNAIFVRRITRQELDLDELERGFGRTARAGPNVRVLDVRRERHSGIDMVRFDNAIRLERPVRSSYFLFGAAGSSFQIECQSTAQKRAQLLRGCREVVDGIKRR